MSFTEWIFLLGSLAVVGPVIAHLLAKPRYRRLPFTMLRFLRSGQIESHSRQKLRDLLILLLRCVIIVLIAMLFTRPLLHVRNKPSQSKSVYCLGLDNSMSMAYSDLSGSYFDTMKNRAFDYIRDTKNDALFNIYALASGEWKQGLSKGQAIAEVKDLEIKPGNTNVEDFLSSLRRIIRTEHDNDEISVLVMSDFTPKTFRQFVDAAEPVAAGRIDYESIVSSQLLSNAAIIDAHVAGIVEGELILNAAVVNYGQVEQNRVLIARTQSKQSNPVAVNLLGNQRNNYQIKLNVGAAGRQACVLPVELNLSGSDGLNEDDTFYMAVSIPGREDVNILLAGESENGLFLLKTALETLPRNNSYDILRIKQVMMDELTASDLAWANIVISSTICDQLSNLASEFESFIKAGGRFVCFVTESFVPDSAKQLWERDILAALPSKYVPERTYIESKPCNSRISGVDHIAERSLSNYRIDKILIKGCFECKQNPDARLVWQFQDGIGFVYLKCLGNGTSILVNTSVDSSLGSLTKSSASVAFCRYLLGESHRVDEYCFTCDERILLPISDQDLEDMGQKQFWIETCDGKNHRAQVADSFLLVSDPAGIGWVKTMGKPAMCAGVNLLQGETDMTKPLASELEGVMDRVFKTGSEQIVSEAELFSGKKRRPLWKIFAWMIILLLLVEPAFANRLKR